MCVFASERGWGWMGGGGVEVMRRVSLRVVLFNGGSCVRGAEVLI